MQQQCFWDRKYLIPFSEKSDRPHVCFRGSKILTSSFIASKMAFLESWNALSNSSFYSNFTFGLKNGLKGSNISVKLIVVGNLINQFKPGICVFGTRWCWKLKDSWYFSFIWKPAKFTARCQNWNSSKFCKTPLRPVVQDNRLSSTNVSQFQYPI